VTRVSTIGKRTIGIALVLGMALQWMQVQGVGAAGSVTLAKQATDLTSGTTTVSQGDIIQYTITATNTGASTITGITINDTLQGSQSLVAGSCMPACTQVANTLQFSPANLASGASTSVSFRTTVTGPVGPGGVVQNTASLAANGGTSATSNTTTLVGGAAPPPVSGVTLNKQATDLTSTTGNVSQGDTIRYTITASNNSGVPISGVTISDTLLSGQSYGGTCTNPAGGCSQSGFNMVQFTIPTLSPGPTSVSFTAVVSGAVGPGGVVQNTATLTGAGGTVNATSNTTTLVGAGATNPCIYNPYAPGCNPCGNPYTAGCNPCQLYSSGCFPPCTTGCNPCNSYYANCNACYGFQWYCQYGVYCNGVPGNPFCPGIYPPGSCGCSAPPPCTYSCGSPCTYGCGGYAPCTGSAYGGGCFSYPTTSAAVVCGTLNGYTVPTGSGGSLTVNAIGYYLSPGAVINGNPVVGQGYCFSFTFNAVSLITSVSAVPYGATAPYVCGAVTQYTGVSTPPGAAPIAGPPGTVQAPPGTTPGGPYPVTTAYGPGFYGWGGPLVIGGYPYPVAPGTAFPFQPGYGNNYCFAVSPQGAVTGSLSVVPTAAFAVESPGGYKHGKEIGS
jgi:uncharacterized repeat protein (TIGR01451 family)